LKTNRIIIITVQWTFVSFIWVVGGEAKPKNYVSVALSPQPQVNEGL